MGMPARAWQGHEAQSDLGEYSQCAHAHAGMRTLREGWQSDCTPMPVFGTGKRRLS